jgi:hypothetical protein
MSLEELAQRERDRRFGKAWKSKLTAVLIRDGIRYERDLAPHFWHVELYRVCPPRNETAQAFEAWAHRTVTL